MRAVPAPMASAAVKAASWRGGGGGGGVEPASGSHIGVLTFPARASQALAGIPSAAKNLAFRQMRTVAHLCGLHDG